MTQNQPGDGDILDTAHIGSLVYEASIEQLQRLLASGEATARDLVVACFERIEALDQNGPATRTVIELNPDALEIAEQLDRERAEGRLRSPLHGIPVLIKDNIDTCDAMHTTAGSLALEGSRPRRDATVVERLRAAGVVLLGKTNMSEWANFRSSHSSSGWSGRGRQTRNPHALDRSPSGSSSGSAAAAAASYCAAALGTETDGSIVSPSGACGVVGIKPTVGLTSRAGVIPIAATQDTVGVHARSVRDAALVLNAMIGSDERDPATAAQQYAVPLGIDYTEGFTHHALEGTRLGVIRNARVWERHAPTDAVMEAALAALRDAGATLVDVELPEYAATFVPEEMTVLLYEFKEGLERYLAEVDPLPNMPAPPRTLAEIIAFNQQHAEAELPYFGQDVLVESSTKGGLTQLAYLEALAQSRDRAREGIQTVIEAHQLDALVAPTGLPAWPIDLVMGDRSSAGSSSPAARAGFPIVTVPAGFVLGLPVGLSFMGLAYSEPVLLRLAYAFEQATRLRRAPLFRQSIDAP